MTTQAPHAIRTVVRARGRATSACPKRRSAIISPDIGGGFGGKVPVYPGYVIAVAASVVTGKPVKWIEDRIENLQADSFARDYHMTRRAGGEEGRHAHRAAHQDRRRPRLHRRRGQSVQVPGRALLTSAPAPTTSRTAYVEVDGVYTNKPPGGIAYRCSFRVTEAVHTIERMADIMAHELGMDPAEFRMKNFIKPEQFPYKSALGWEYDSGNYAGGPARRRWR